jgi:short subunit dehydrogenase-like uncharacterized protein
LIERLGFTGKYVAKEVSQCAQKSKLKWAVAGRDANKLTGFFLFKVYHSVLMNRLLNDSAIKPTVLTADAHHYDELLEVVSRCKVLINCVGPVSLNGLTKSFDSTVSQ